MIREGLPCYHVMSDWIHEGMENNEGTETCWFDKVGDHTSDGHYDKLFPTPQSQRLSMWIQQQGMNKGSDHNFTMFFQT